MINIMLKQNKSIVKTTLFALVSTIFSLTLGVEAIASIPNKIDQFDYFEDYSVEELRQFERFVVNYNNDCWNVPGQFGQDCVFVPGQYYLNTSLITLDVSHCQHNLNIVSKDWDDVTAEINRQKNSGIIPDKELQKANIAFLNTYTELNITCQSAQKNGAQQRHISDFDERQNTEVIKPYY
jgi:hypothetical protein